MDGGSRMTIDPRIPTMPGRSRSGSHRPSRHCLHQARSAVMFGRVASRVSCILLRTAWEAAFFASCVLSCIRMTASIDLKEGGRVRADKLHY